MYLCIQILMYHGVPINVSECILHGLTVMVIQNLYFILFIYFFLGG